MRFCVEDGAMNEASTSARRQAKRRTRDRAKRNAIVGPPRPTLRRSLADYDAFPDEMVAETHQRVLTIVADIGIEFRDEESLALWRQAGASVDGALVRMPGELLMELFDAYEVPPLDGAIDDALDDFVARWSEELEK